MSRHAPLHLLLTVLALLVAACGGGAEGAAGSTAGEPADVADRPLRIGAIPDQDPEVLSRQFGQVADVLAEALDVEVEYVPVTEYTAAVTLFATGDIDLVWFGGLTGVQARLQTPGARVLAQRDIDASFRSVFIAAADAGIDPVQDVEGLAVFEGTRFTFGSESSTSGRLMPQFFLGQAGVGPDDFAGEAGFSGSHDATIDLVEAGTFQGGALNTQVWQARRDAGEVDLDRVVEVFTTPEYADYHWLANPQVEDAFGAGFGDRVAEVLLGLSPDDPEEASVLGLFGAAGFVPVDPGAHDRIEQVGRELGLIVE